MKKIHLTVLIGVLAVCFVSCSDQQVENQKTTTSSNIEKEFELLSSETELNALLTRGNEGIVDWELSREIAQMQLDSFIEDGDYPETSELWELPIGIYNQNGEIRFYEFRVINDSETIAAITINAQENLGGPIAYVFSMKGYFDTLMELYNNGALSENEIPRIVDDVYPNYAIAASQITKNGNISFEKLISPENGEAVKELNTLMTTEEFIKENPDVFTEEEKSEKLEEISNYRQETADFWKSAKENKGNLGNMVFRGGSKKQRKEVDSRKIQNAIDKCAEITKKRNSKSYSRPVGYGACGATASGFILDYFDANFENVPNWNKIKSYDERIDALRSALSIRDNSSITWPWNLTGAVSKYSNYKIESCSFWPKASINNDIPGINLRALKFTSWDDFKGGFHYRNVIAYKEEGWWIFKWKYIKILDGNNCENGWEAYNPFWHVSSYNVVRK
ncbi:MAG: hypothetical protein MR937_01390 [Spirochaetia bacterium]|uniref:hypothetical protein n=1 Tax=Treponema berlinense TaxID=225004 RepID=UPI002352BD2C|nr:hypothetical protein [Treponema berlinense]MCI5609714.1 hypothetical protein [Spirochaetia bacterium]MDD6929662.1 hypothetical protein [Treponema sp.]MCI6825954.1 hypothetical protein [Spirochaetia bacterium]MDY3887206.1 hypothetical protein [Treponema sp.]MDY4153102.1 hypothetical protein [Treponema sp.]